MLTMGIEGLEHNREVKQSPLDDNTERKLPA